MNTLPIVQADFQDAAGVRIFSFALCIRRPAPFGTYPLSALESVAVVRMETGRCPEIMTVKRLEPKRRAILRLAERYLNRSVPVHFTPAAA